MTATSPSSAERTGKYGVRREHYAAFRTALLAAAARFTPSRSGTGNEWLAAFDHAAELMASAAEAAAALRDLGADPALLQYDLPEEIA